jgi:YD repeat-containing protein
MSTCLRLSVVLLLFILAAPAEAQQIRWGAVFGDPCCGLPPEILKYLDPHEACVQENPITQSNACVFNHPGSVIAVGGGGARRCMVLITCLCGDCLSGPPGSPSSTGYLWTGKTAYGQAVTCPSGTVDYLGRCDADPAKDIGPCPDCNDDRPQANPANIGSGNKYQSEVIYRARDLELVLTYNSQVGVTYFQKGNFGSRWSARYFVRVRDSGQGIVAAQRPGGRELEFRAPASGNAFIAQDDISDRLERVVDGSGNVLQWQLTSTDDDRVEEHDGPAALLRYETGTLLRIRNRQLQEQTLTYSTASTPPAVAPMPGLPLAVTDPYGRQLQFTYDTERRVSSMTDPAGGIYLFEYDGPSGPAGANNLTKVTFPGGATRVYFYAETAHINGGTDCPAPLAGRSNLLTGIQDENGARFATWTYDCQSRATSSQHAGGADLHAFTYGSTDRVVVDPLGASRTIPIQRVLGVAKAIGVSQPAASGSGTASRSSTFDANGNRASRTDYNGNRTNYTYDLARNLETSRTEGLIAGGGTTPQTRTISTQWHPTFRLRTATAEPLRVTTNAYDTDGTACGARGALCSRTIQATTDANGSLGFSATSAGAQRLWTYTYNANGSVLTVDGPRTDASDTTTYTYYANDDADPGKRANVATITNAAGHVTSITAYNGHGQPLTIIDANGTATTLAYDARQRLTSRIVGSEATSYDYDNVGQLTKVTLPDGSFLNYNYDAAHRLTEISDNLGNRITYSLDAIGNRTAEQVRDPSNVLAQARSREYNNLNRLFKELGAQSQTTEYSYDDQGNVTSVRDPLNRVTANQYDALNRLKQVTDPGTGVTQYGYNGLDALTSVTDPRSLVTGYTVDGLGNLSQQASPDTGTTTNTYDAAGNLLTQTDAKSQATAYTYDALNRVAQITFHDGSKQVYAYDQNTNGIGRLSSITERDPANAVTNQTSYTYDSHGRVATIATAHGGVTYTVGYTYDSSGRLSGMTYPSGRTITYAFDALGRVNQVSTTKAGQTQTVVSAVAYQPFGGVKGYTLGNGQTYARSIDLDGRIASYTLGSQAFAIGYDAASRIEFISDLGAPVNSNTYGYDALDRLTSATTPGVPYSYGYDAVGNRTSKTVSAATEAYTYSATSNRIATVGSRSFAFDPNGSTTADGNNTYAYDTRGRMVQATSVLGATNYKINALGQRVRKTNTLGDTVFHYDTNGRLIAETDPGGALKRELIYLGDIPVGAVQ